VVRRRSAADRVANPSGNSSPTLIVRVTSRAAATRATSFAIGRPRRSPCTRRNAVTCSHS
jgi:hypothetical protein